MAEIPDFSDLPLVGVTPPKAKAAKPGAAVVADAPVDVADDTTPDFSDLPLIGVAPPPAQEGGGIVDTVKDFATGAMNAITGEGRYQPGIPELGASGPDVPPFSTEGLTMLGAYATSSDPAGVADIAVKTLPGATRKKDEFGNEMVDWKGKEYYINRPGVSEADLFKLVADIASYAPAARVAAIPKSIAGRAITALPTFAGTSTLQDAASQALGSEQPIDTERAVAAGAAGAAGELLSPAVQKMWRAIVGNRSLFDRATGKLTESGVRAARSAGLDPDTLTPDLAANFATQMAKAVDVFGATGTRAANEAASARATGEFGIPYTAGQRSGKISQVRREEATRQGALGDGASETLRKFDDRQRQAMVDASDGIRSEIADGAPSANRQAAARTVQDGAQRTEAAFDKAVDDAYAKVREQFATNPPRLTGNSFRDIREATVRAIRNPEGGLFGVDRVTAPLTMTTLRELRIPAETGTRIKATTLESIEATRRRINTRIEAAANNPTDRRGLVIAKRALDDWLDGAIDGALFSGDPEALNLLKEARSARFEYGKRFGLTGPRDDAGKFVRKLLDQSTTPEEIARGIFGAARAYPQSATRIVTRLEGMFGADSAEMAAVREMGWMKINSDAIEESLKGEKSFSPRKFISSLRTALKDNETLMAKLYTPEQAAKFKRFAVDVERSITPADAQNPSRTAWALSMMARDFFRNVMTGAALMNAGPTAAVLTRGAMEVGQETLSRLGARSAVRPGLPAPRSALMPALTSALAVQGNSSIQRPE